MLQKTEIICSAFAISLWFVWAQGNNGPSPQMSLDLLDGSSVTLDCGTSSTPVVWFLNGNIIPSVTMQVHKVDNLDASDAGVYECAAMLSNGSLLPRRWIANITVGSIVAPAQQYALIGKSANLICSVNMISNEIFIFWYSFQDPSVNGSSNVVINAVSLLDDHSFICNVLQSVTSVFRTIHLHVIAPPTINYSPIGVIDILLNNTCKNLTVLFSSRPANSTIITWYKNGISLSKTINITTILGELEGNTSLVITPQTRRADAGVYTVVIENSVSGIPSDMQKTNTSFELNLKIFPATPTNVTVYQKGSMQVSIVWFLIAASPDEIADNCSVQMKYLNGTMASQTTVLGNITNASLQVFPGMIYAVQLIAYNIDGSVTTDPVQYTTLPGAACISSATIHRVNFTAFNFYVTLAYNGGADISSFNISYRPSGSELEWSTSFIVNITSSMSYSAEAVIDFIMEQHITIGPLEFNIIAVNALLYQSSPKVFNETIDLPGAPCTPFITYVQGKPYIVEVQLSEKGSPPLIEVVLVVMILNAQWILTMPGPYLPGNHVLFNLSSLPDGSTFIFSAYAVNYAGEGPYSPQVTTSAASTTKDNIPLWSIAILALFGTVVCSSIIILLAYVYTARLRGEKLDASRESVNCRVRVFPPLAAPLVPRSPTVKPRYYHSKSSTAISTSMGALPLYDEETPCDVYVHHYATAASTESLKCFKENRDFTIPTLTSSATDV